MRRMTHRVFVYGTLKSGFPNHYLLEGCEFFGRAVTVPTYKMIENGFPVIIPDPDGRRLAGEIYVVDDETLARLDRLEREGSSYDQRRATADQGVHLRRTRRSLWRCLRSRPALCERE
jgi:gamma-glutamylcyclotransferase (GGCT)/AIG2-like uncharacterized protein YtfP